jgi:hypothetical protein
VTGIASQRVFWRQVCLTLAALAVFVKVLVPPGFMVAPAQTNELPFPLVLCTGQGPMTIDPGGTLPGRVPTKHAPGEKTPHEAPCTFAAHSVAAPGPNLLDPAPVEFMGFERLAPQRPRFDVSPGRGLAAPPLPARGPPDRSI